jgi:hypothetical protein
VGEATTRSLEVSLLTPRVKEIDLVTQRWRDKFFKLALRFRGDYALKSCQHRIESLLSSSVLLKFPTEVHDVQKTTIPLSRCVTD